jgi:hypothetical protein
VTVTDEAEAAVTLLSTYKRLGMERRPRDYASSCVVKFTAVREKKDRCWSWRVKDSVLNVESMDTSIDAGVVRLTASFVVDAVDHDPRHKVRFWFVPQIVAGLLSMFAILFILRLMAGGYGDFGALVGIFSAIVMVPLFAWGDRLARASVVDFVERLVKATSLDEGRVRSTYADFIRRTFGRRFVIGLEVCILLLALVSWLFSRLMGPPGFFVPF